MQHDVALVDPQTYGEARPGGRTARTREAVLAATLDVLRSDGYAGFTFEGVAERAGVHRTTIYRRWRTREALVADAMLSISEAEVPIPDTGDVRTDLVRFARSVRDTITSPLARAVVAAVADPRAALELEAVAERFWSARFAANRRIVERALERGELPRGTDPRLVVEAVAGPVYFRAFVTGDTADDAYIERVVDLVLGAMRRD